MFKNMILGNWRTSCFGILGAALQTVAGGGSWKSAAMSIPMLLLGLSAKDASTGSQAGK
jgi:hypothetical protein